jgi:predicted secreted Zn-dependent protease
MVDSSAGPAGLRRAGVHVRRVGRPSRSRRISRWALLVALSAAGPATAQERAGGVHVERNEEYFDVTLATMPQLATVVRERRARGVDWFGLTKANLRWSVMVDDRGGCRLQSARVDLSLTVVLPRLAPGIRLGGRDDVRWRELVEHVERHEAEHVRIATDGAYRVLDAIQGSSCKAWRAAAEREVRLMNQRQAEFDRADTEAGRAEFTRAVEPDTRSPEEQSREQELNGRPVEWTVGD